MNNESVVIIFNIVKRDFTVDLEVPLHITANELIVGLNEAYELDIDTTDVKACYLKAENPIALIKGNRTLSEFGIRNGTIINFTR